MARYKRIMIVVSAALIAGCTPAVRDTRPPAAQEEAPVTESDVSRQYRADRRGSPTFLDTINRGKELTLAAADLPVLEVEVTAASPSMGGAGFIEIPVDAPPRYRVQILASSQVDQVRKEKLTAESVTSLPVTMTSEQSLYKLFIGDFKSKADAEAALPEIRKMGYRDAWVVSTK